MPPSRYEYGFDPDRANHTAASVFRFAREGGVRVLDLGSGPGIVSGALAEQVDKDVTCVDIESDHLEAASERGVQRTILSDLTSSEWLDQVAGEAFDVIILADVLEHLVEPGELLRQLRRADLVAERGFLVISIPNAAHISIIGALAAGDFPYRPTGLLDETHLRFFTLKSMRRLLEAHGFVVDRVARTIKQLHESEIEDASLPAASEVTRALAGISEEHDVYQYVLRATPMETGPSVSISELEELRARLRKSEKVRRKERRRRSALASELKAIKASTTWRVGRIFVAPVSALRRLSRGRSR